MMTHAAMCTTLCTLAARTQEGPQPLTIPGYGESLLRMMVSLAAVVGLLLAAAWLIRWRRRTLPTDGRHVLGVVSSCALNGGQSVHLLKVGDQFILVGAGPQGIRPINEVMLDDASLAARVREDATRPPVGPCPARDTRVEPTQAPPTAGSTQERPIS